MSRSYDIFLSHSGAQKPFVKYLNEELARVCGHYSVFFDQEAIKHGEQISTSILEYAKTCKLVVIVMSEEYFTRSKPPMMELAASYIAAKAGNEFLSLPCLLPVFLALRPEDAKELNTESGWWKIWQKWEVNEKMSERRKSGSCKVQLTVWKEAVDFLLDTRGPIYKPRENGHDPKVFLKKVAQIIGEMLDDLKRGIEPLKLGDELVPLHKEEDVRKDSIVGLGCAINKLMGCESTSLIRVVRVAMEALPEPYKVLVCLEFGSMSSMFSCSSILDPGTISTPQFADMGLDKFSCRIATGIYYYSRDGQSYEVKAWGNVARSDYEQDKQRARISNEHFMGIYVTRFNPHLKVQDMQVSSTEELLCNLSMEKPIIDYLRELGAFILNEVQGKYGHEVSMKMIQWCVPIPSSWDNAVEETMKTCMEVAGLLNGVDGSPYPVKMVGEVESALIQCGRVQQEVDDKALVVNIGEESATITMTNILSIHENIGRYEERTSSLFTCTPSPALKFLELLHEKIGPCLQGFLNDYASEGSLEFLNHWRKLDLTFANPEWRPDHIKMVLPTRLVYYWQVHDLLWGIRGRKSYDHIEISLREFRTLFDPAIDEALVCIAKKCDELGRPKVLVLVGDLLLGSTYVMEGIKEELPKLVPVIVSTLGSESTVRNGALKLALRKLEDDRKREDSFRDFQANTFSFSIKSKYGGRMDGRNNTKIREKRDLEKEWMRLHEPGVYIELTTLPNGQIDVVGLTFRRNEFTEESAELWWVKNEVLVREQYCIKKT